MSDDLAGTLVICVGLLVGVYLFVRVFQVIADPEDEFFDELEDTEPDPWGVSDEGSEEKQYERE